jgi:hypothetical protein
LALQVCRKVARVSYLSLFAWPDLIGCQGDDRDGFSIERGEFDFVTFASLVHENNGSDIARR